MLNDLFQEHAQAKSTGTALLVFKNKSLGKIYFANGVPTSARYLAKQGDEAMTSMHQLDIASSVFHQNIDAVLSNAPVQGIPAAGSSEAKAPPVNSRPTGTRDTPQQSTNANSFSGLSPTQRQQIGDLLAEYLGPVSHILVNRLSAETAVSDAIESLTSNISDTNDAKRFSSETRKLLGA